VFDGVDVSGKSGEGKHHFASACTISHIDCVLSI
jgi:hypothetical protein